MAKFLNALFSTTLIALAVFSWVYYLTKNGDIALIVGGISVVPSVCVFVILSRRTPTNKSTNKQYKSLEQYLYTSPNATAIIDKLLTYLQYKTQTQYDDISSLVTKDGKQILLIKHLYPKMLDCDKLTDYIRLARAKSQDSLLLITTSLDATSYKLLSVISDIDIKIITADKLYELLKQHDMLPQLNIPKKSVSDSAILRYAFCKARSRQYFVASLFLFILSRFAYFPLYMLIWSTLLGIAGLYSRYNKRYNTPSNKPIL